MTVTQGPVSHQEARQLLADPAITASSPGEEFTQAATLGGGKDDITVSFRAYLPEAFPLFAERPRYTVRHLLKVATIRDCVTPYFYENLPDDERRTTLGTTYEATLEATYTSTLADAKLTDISVSVPIPSGMLAHPRQFAAFLDYRVLVRFGVRENQTLLHGDDDGIVQGLLTLPGLRRVYSDQRPIEHLITAAAAVEETGGSCDGVVAHPSVYWQAVESGLLGRLAEAGVRIARTRMIPREQLLLGDFRAAATLLDPAVSSLTLRRGASPDGCDLIEARSRIGLAVHLPQHFVLVQTGAGS